jgi:hypothetical protein
VKRSSGDNSWVVAPCENSSMPGKIFSNLVSFDFLIKADFVSHLKWWLFFGFFWANHWRLGAPGDT